MLRNLEIQTPSQPNSVFFITHNNKKLADPARQAGLFCVDYGSRFLSLSCHLVRRPTPLLPPVRRPQPMGLPPALRQYPPRWFPSNSSFQAVHSFMLQGERKAHEKQQRDIMT